MLSSDLCQENASVSSGPTSLTTQRHHTPPAHRTVKTSTDQNIQSCHRPWLLSWHKWTWFFRTPFKWSLNKWLKFHISCSAPRSSIIASCVAHVLALYLSSFIDIQLCTVSSNFQLAIIKFRNHVCPGSRWACTYSGRLSPSHPEIVLCSLAHVFKTSTFMTSNVFHDTFTSSSKLPLHVRYWSYITCGFGTPLRTLKNVLKAASALHCQGILCDVNVFLHDLYLHHHQTSHSGWRSFSDKYPSSRQEK